MSGTIESVATLISEQPDNTSGAIKEQNMRNLSESSFAVVAQTAKTAAYTPANINDRGTVVPFNSASNAAAVFTIPPYNASTMPWANGNVLGIMWVSGAAGAPSFAQGAGVTIVPSATPALRAAGSIGYAFMYSQNVWYVFGDFA